MPAALSSFALIAMILVALIFDCLNGLHDAANSIATVVSTRVLRPQYAVIWAAFFNFIAFLFFGLHVAQTVGTGIVAAEVVDAAVIFGALMGAICWNLITWWLGIPSSSSHALLVLAVSWVFVRSSPSAVDNFFRTAQLVSAALYSLGHGGNDAQKTMGIIAVLLYSQGLLGEAFYIPFWVILSCQAAMGFGTLVGGWRIVHTMGSRITRLHPVQGFCAEAGGAMTLFLATYFGIPVSTTHTITGAIVGVGAARKVAAVRWNVASNVVVAWIVTLPAAALFGAVFYEFYEFLS
jgi:PiT family inorganic phosphate transporter